MPPSTQRSSPSPLRKAANAIPTALKSFIAVLLNWGFTLFLGYLAAPWISSDLDAIDRPLKTLQDYSGLAATKAVEILAYWIGGWDATQAASLSLLTIAPTLHYTHKYQPSHARLFPTLAVSTINDIIAIWLPMKFLRPSTHRGHRHWDQSRLFMASLAASVYQLCLHVGAEKFLTSWLIQSGWDLESASRDSKLKQDLSTLESVNFMRILLMFPVGWAASEIINFNGVKSASEEDEVAKGFFNFPQRLWRKFSPRTRQIIKRSIVVTTFQAAGATTGSAAVKGGNWLGAAGMAGVWALSTVLVGVILGWVENI